MDSAADEDELDSMAFAVVADVLSHPCDLGAPRLVIRGDSFLGLSIQDRTKTAYVFENQYRVLPSGTPYNFMVTTCLLNCIAVIANVPGGVSLLAHISIASVYSSIDEAAFMRRGAGPIQNLIDSFRRVFEDVDPATVTVSLVGGWGLSDFGTKLKTEYYPYEPSLWTFSGVLIYSIQKALPGIRLDVSRLNMFDGVSLSNRTIYAKLRAVATGQAFRFVILNTISGDIDTQTTDLDDITGDITTSVRMPASVINDTLAYQEASYQRSVVFGEPWTHGCLPPPILEEYVEE
jgi:hypothetical protein